MKKYYINLILAGLPVLLFLCAACGGKKLTNAAPEPAPVPLMMVDTTETGLVLYFPPTDSLDLRCFDRPDPELDNSIVFCCAAAFTADFATVPDHNRICGDHVSGGRYYPRPMLKRNTGAFVVKDSSWVFLYTPQPKQNSFRSDFLKAKAGFTQEMMIHQGKKVKTTRPEKNVNQFRALCQIGQKLCIADAAEPMPFGSFIQALLDAGAGEAIYMDMGPGWNYSWYREYADSAATFIHSWPIESATNWLVFHTAIFKKN